MLLNDIILIKKNSTNKTFLMYNEFFGIFIKNVKILLYDNEKN